MIGARIRRKVIPKLAHIIAFMSFTVVPLHNLNLLTGTRVPLGNGFVLQDAPEWVKDDKGILADIDRNDRQATLDARHALVAEYEAQAIGEPDTNWQGKKPKSIQDLKFQSSTPVSDSIFRNSFVNRGSRSWIR